MALNEAIARVTRYSIAFLITQDGAAGTTMTLTNFDLVGNLVGPELGGPLLDLLSEDLNPNSQALQRARLLGDGTGLGGGNQNMEHVPHCHAFFTPRDAAVGWAVDADVDGGTPSRGELNITGPSGASSALITLEFRHTYDR